MKRADITPFPKEEKSNDKKNFRPISVLPAGSKIFVRILHKQISSHITTGRMICKNVQKRPHYGRCITADLLFSATREGTGDQMTKIHDFFGLGFEC